MIVTCAVAYAAWAAGMILPASANLGLGLPSPGTWLSPGVASLAVSLASLIAVGVLLIWMNKTFNILRSLTSLGATLFFFMVCGMPGLAAHFYGGTLLTLVAVLCMILLFTTYGTLDQQRHTFLVFMLLTLCGFFQISFLLYIPVFLVGCMQMRTTTLRTFIAAFLGIVTPAWILFGFGIVRPDMLHWPDMVMVWDVLDAEDMVKVLVEVGFVLICGISFMMANLLRILSYNSRVRAYNGFINLLWIATALFTVLNFNDFAFYFILLNLLTACQAAHFFSYHRNRRSYLPILLLIAVSGVFCLLSFIS